MSMLNKLAGRAAKAVIAAVAGYAIKRLIEKLMQPPAGPHVIEAPRVSRNARRRAAAGAP
jgi:hypothetical protein